MNEKDVVKEVLSVRGWSQAKLAEECGYKYQSNVTGLLNRGENAMRVDKLLEMLKALGCELVVRDKMGSGKEWKIG